MLTVVHTQPRMGHILPQLCGTQGNPRHLLATGILTEPSRLEEPSKVTILVTAQPAPCSSSAGRSKIGVTENTRQILTLILENWR